MYSRVTLLEIDTTRVGVEDALERFTDEVLPELRAQDGYEGVIVLTTPEGRGMIVTVWETEEAAAGTAGFAAAALDRYVTLFRAPPGREYYEVALAEMLPGALAG